MIPRSAYAWALLAAVVPALLAVRAVDSAEPTPFYTYNQGPLVQVYGLPMPRAGKVISAGHVESTVVLNIANNSTFDSRNGEDVHLDGETYRLDLILRYGLAAAWDVEMVIPYVSHEEGSLDGFIDSFHDTFGLPQGNRNELEDNELMYFYGHNGSLRVHLVEHAAGWGDARISFGTDLWSDACSQRHMALRAGLKLPTGDADDLLGSGGTDVFVHVCGTDTRTLSPWNVHVNGSVGLLLTGTSDILDDQREDWVGFGSMDLEWPLWRRVHLKLQLDGHSPLYRDTDLDQLKSWAAQLTTGGTIILGDKRSLDIAVVEDLVVSTSPDVVFHFALRQQF